MSFLQVPLFNELLSALPFSALELVELIQTAPTRYKNHYIDKRNGRGKRLISQPTKEVKLAQRYLVAHTLRSLPVHPSATAYRIGASIKDHALPHANARYLLKLDFEDFFPSITATSLARRLEMDSGLEKQEIAIVVRLLCRYDLVSDQLRLSIGAPSSPCISNYFMFEFDKAVSGFCDANSICYTRYADDLAFSTNLPKMLDAVQAHVLNTLDEMAYLGLRLNEKKTVNVSKKNRRTLVGLTLSNEGSVSVGRDAKRGIRNQLHRASKGDLTLEEFQRLKGQLAFMLAVDPDFVMALCRKHGVARIADLSFRSKV